MANCCFYWLQVVSPSVESLERLVSIMKYEDPRWYIYRVRECSYEPIDIVDGLYHTNIQGEVAWGVSSWLEPVEKSEKTDNGAEYTNLVELSKYLDLGIYAYAETDSDCAVFHLYKGKILFWDTVDMIDQALELDDYEDYGDDLIEECEQMGMPEEDVRMLRATINTELAKNRDDRAYLNIRAGGYDWCTRTVGDIYSMKPLTPVIGGIKIED